MFLAASARDKRKAATSKSKAATDAGADSFSHPGYYFVMSTPTFRRAVFPGQFDPITSGHLDVIRRGTKLFDELIVGVGVNPDKREMFSVTERVEMIQELLGDIPGAGVLPFGGLTMNFVRDVGATTILRGIRDATDLRYEFQLAMANRAVGGIETVFIMTGDQFALTSSSLIRQVVTLGGDASQLAAILPQTVIKRLLDWQKRDQSARPKR